MDIVVADAKSGGKSIANDRSNVGRDTKSLVFARSRSLQATSDIEVIGQGKLVVVEKPFEANVTGEVVSPVLNEVTMEAARPRGSLVPSSGVEDPGLVALRAHIQDLQAENEALSACHAKNQKI